MKRKQYIVQQMVSKNNNLKNWPLNENSKGKNNKVLLDFIMLQM